MVKATKSEIWIFEIFGELQYPWAINSALIQLFVFQFKCDSSNEPFRNKIVISSPSYVKVLTSTRSILPYSKRRWRLLLLLLSVKHAPRICAPAYGSRCLPEPPTALVVAVDWCLPSFSFFVSTRLKLSGSFHYLSSPKMTVDAATNCHVPQL